MSQKLLLRPRCAHAAAAAKPLLRTLTGHAGWVNAVAITPDGRRSISASRDGTLKLWHLDTGSELATLRAHAAEVMAVRLLPDGRRAISASDDATLNLWDLETGAVLRTFQGHTTRVSAVAVTPDGLRVVSGSRDRTVRIWSLETGAGIQTLRGHSDWVSAVAVSPDGSRAVSASDDRSLIVWDLQSACALRTLAGHQREVKAIAITADGRFAVSSSYDRTLRLWDLASGRQLSEIGPVYGATLALSPDGRHVASESFDRRLRVWDLASGSELCHIGRHEKPCNALAFTPDGQRLLSASDDGTLKLWDIEAAMARSSLPGHARAVRTILPLPDGRTAITASDDGVVKRWCLSRGTELLALTRACCFPCRMALLPGGDLLSATSEGQLHVSPLDRLSHVETGFYPVAASSDGRFAACAVYEELHIWDLKECTRLHKLDQHEFSIGGVAFTPDGSLVLSASDDCTLRVWEVESGALRFTLTHGGAVWSVAAMPDAIHAVTAADGLRIWDVRTGVCALAIPGARSSARQVAVAPGGSRLVTAGFDSAVRLWDTHTGECLAAYEADEPVHACAATEQMILAGDDAGRIYFLEVECCEN